MKKLLFYKKPGFWISTILNIALLFWLFDLNKKNQQEVHFVIDVLRSEQSAIMKVPPGTKDVPIRNFSGVLLWFKKAPKGDEIWNPDFLDDYTIIGFSDQDIMVDVPKNSEGFIMKGYFQ